ncbi:MAG: TMEM165/GDT1 family protein [Mycobacteriales bacterium]
MNPAVVLTTLLVILPVELPDKTLMATLVLSTRYRAGPVLLGVSAAFAVQCAIAVTAGQLLTLLPERLLAGVVAVLFGIGAVILLHGGSAEEEDELGAARAARRGPLAVAATSFGVLFAAEWGDASQLATAALTARYQDPIAVFIGSFVALVGVAALAVVLGGIITRRVPLQLVQRIAGVLFAVFALIALWEAIHP